MFRKLNKLHVRRTQETHTKIHNDPTSKARDRENLKSCKTQMNHDVQGILNRIMSRFLIRNLEAEDTELIDSKY